MVARVSPKKFFDKTRLRYIKSLSLLTSLRSYLRRTGFESLARRQFFYFLIFLGSTVGRWQASLSKYMKALLDSLGLDSEVHSHKYLSISPIKTICLSPTILTLANSVAMRRTRWKRSSRQQSTSRWISTL